MGACLSMVTAATPLRILDQVDGDEQAYHERYLEDAILGEGEFGIVKLVHDTRQQQATAVPLACKVLRKGIVFKDNTLYSPTKPEILRGEVEMLRTLHGQHYCLKLVACYETPKLIYMVTDYCGGGEMMEYVAQQSHEDWRTEDVSRIAFQLLRAVQHCADHHIIHRDIKPENCMFVHAAAKADLRLIDFGSGTMDAKPIDPNNVAEYHTTFAGSAFYISPELFQRTYTTKTDVWSVGATLYVLAAGYPADQLQKAFNILQNNAKSRNLKNLPNMPDNMPESYFDLLNQLLTYRHKQRPSAGEVLTLSEFVQFHQEMDEATLSIQDVSAAAAAAAAQESPMHMNNNNNSNNKNDSRTKLRNNSVSLRGSVGRHGVFLNFKKFEWSLTTLLATLLSTKELTQLLDLLRDRIGEKIANDDEDDGGGAILEDEEKIVVIAAPSNNVSGASKAANDTTTTAPRTTASNQQRLHVVQIRELKSILQDMNKQNVIETMEKLPSEAVYENFAYHVALLQDFSRDYHARDASGFTNSAGRRPSMRLGRGLMIMTDSQGSAKSTQSFRSSQKNNSRRGTLQPQQPSSVHGASLFASRPKPVKVRSLSGS